MKDRQQKKKSLKEHAEEVIQGVVEAVESLLSPAPTLVPVVVRPRPRRRR